MDNTVTRDMEDYIRASQTVEHSRGNIDVLLSSSISRGRAVEVLTSPEVMADFFRSRLSALFPEGSVLRECRPHVLRDRLGSRQVVSYRLILSDKAGRKAEPMLLVLKRYADQREGEKTYHTMKMLWENGFNNESKQRISKPFCYLEDLGLLVLGKARGMLLRKNLHQNGPAALDRMRAVARWLAKLHQLNADLKKISPHPDEETSIKDFINQMGSREHPLLPKLEKLLVSVILMKLASFKNAPMTPVHGDFQCENIFVDRDSVTVVDFDRFCRSDPARDLGYIIAQMRAMAFLLKAPQGSVNPKLQAFWKEYLVAASIEELDAFSARTSLFAARKCLQNIYYMSYVLPGDGVEIVSVLINEAERFAGADRVEEVMEIPISGGPAL